MAVVFAFEGHPVAVLPAGEDGLQGLDIFAHPRCGRAELDAKPVLDMGLDLGADAQQEAALAEGLQIPGLVGQVHGVAGEGHCDAGGNIQLRSVFAGQHQGQERVPATLQRVHAIVTNSRQARGFRGGTGQLGVERPVYFHRPDPVGAVTLAVLHAKGRRQLNPAPPEHQLAAPRAANNAALVQKGEHRRPPGQLT